jgi:hypothetical protein
MNQTVLKQPALKKPTFFEGVAVAFAISVIGSAGSLVSTPLLGRSITLYVLIAVAGFAYLIYLLTRSRERVGRVTTVVLWLAVTAVAWFTGMSFILFVVLQLGLLWLIRSLYFYASVLSALLDLGLMVLSVITAVWALAHTGSVFLTVWAFFLLQALFVAIPRQMNAGNKQTKPQEDTFQRAYRSAETAVRKLSAIR